MNSPSILGRQRGAATLMVVMVLFFVMSLVAAYASRNVLFEQRTSGNQFEATASLEAAEAGLQWALGMVNAGRITDEGCSATADDALPTFRQRYLNIDQLVNGSSGYITVPLAVRNGPLWPVCWFDQNTTQWTCHCPSDEANPGAPGLSPTATFVPSFRVRFVQLNDGGAPSVPGMVRVEVMGCTRYDSACLTFPEPDAALCRATLCAHLALAPGVRSKPEAALTARGQINVTGALEVYNPDASAGGWAIASGGSVATADPGKIKGPNPSTDIPLNRRVRMNDPIIGDAAFDSNRMFAAVFGNWPSTYRQQPSAVVIDCSASCGSAAIRDVIELNPGRVFVVDGDVALDGGASIGTDSDPVVLLVNGQFSFSSPTEVYGLLYVATDNWATSSGAGTVHGAVVAQNQISGTGDFSVIYDRKILDKVRWSSGSFVVPPGGWRDFP